MDIVFEPEAGFICVLALGRMETAEVASLVRSGAFPLISARNFLAATPEKRETLLGALGKAHIMIDVPSGGLEPPGYDVCCNDPRIECLIDEVDHAAAPSSTSGKYWVQVRTVERLLELNQAITEGSQPAQQLAGFVLLGAESGGVSGSQSTFVQMQRLAAAQWASIAQRPLLVRGGVGLYSTPACALAGAAGVLLDEQLAAYPQSPLASTLKARLRETLEGTEAALVGEALGFPVRVLLHPSAPAGRAFETLAFDMEAQAEVYAKTHAAAKTPSQGGDRARLKAAWQQRALAELARTDGGAPLVLGQACGLSPALQRSFPRLQKLVRAVLDAPQRFAFSAATVAAALAPDGALASSHGTRYPIVQGPMTRVSDVPEFAAAIAEHGALPMLALALLPEERADELLNDAARLCAGRPWGVGLLGFVAPELLARQIDVVRRHRPAFALIAGGRADQAHDLERDGIAAYVHAPTPRRARSLVDAGVSRLVLEGRECGGHVGPLHSFVLWEGVVHELLHKPPACGYERLHLLLAGGIHDDVSAMLAMSVAAPLIERGARVGVLMGTAYLATAEAVATAAVTGTFQQAVLASGRTVNLESGRGHAVRCLDTPFADTWAATRCRLSAAGTSAEQRSSELDELAVGRLRIASKGLERDSGQLRPLASERQLAEGMFMAGEVATLLQRQTTLAALHAQVSTGGSALLAAQAQLEAPLRLAAAPLAVAIVGIALHTPAGADADEFWNCLLRQEVCIGEIPRERWDWRLLYKESIGKGEEAISGRWGGFLSPFIFDPLRYGVPPKAMSSIAPAQLIALDVARRALDDAGWNDGRGFPREDTAVIAACADVGGVNGHKMVAKSCAPFMAGPDAVEEIRQRSPVRTEESFPGTLDSVTAGRIANRLDLGGANFTVDSACASSLSALNIATAELAAGRCKAVVLIGADISLTPDQFLNFSSVGALSKTGRIRAFDRAADGTVLAEGVVGMVLKPLADAEREGDRIYAVVRAVGASSDGRSLGMTAPRPLGQRRAVRRAYDIAGFPISQIGLYEAHGTGTPVGDRAELETLTSELLNQALRPESIVLGSVKAQLGHIKTAAGLAGLAKAALALHYKTLPPQAEVENPVAPLTQATCPVFLGAAPLPWFHPGSHPRYAGVSAFGFGGTNAHAVLEEYSAADQAPLGAAQWPCAIYPIGADSLDHLLSEVKKLQRLAARTDLALPALAAALARRVAEQPDAGWALALLADHRAALLKTLEAVAASLARGGKESVANAWFGPRRAARAGKLAFLFPGQGSQKPHMGRDAATYLADFRAPLENAVHAWQAAQGSSETPGLGLDRLIYPPAAFNAELEHRHQARLTDTRVAQVAIGAISVAYLNVLRKSGIRPDFLAGHSYGEFVALHAAGRYDQAALFDLSLKRGAAMHACAAGTMTAVGAERSVVAAVLAKLGGQVVLANHNGPAQVVLSGAVTDIEAAEIALKSAGLSFLRLPVSGAFHSPLIAPARDILAERVAQLEFQPAMLPVYGNADGHPYPDNAQSARQRLCEHMSTPVEFVAQIERMYADGARCFVEVGPGSVLSRLVGKILPDPEVVALALDNGPTLDSLFAALARLWLAGEPVDWHALYPENWAAGSLEGLLDSTPPTLPTIAWWVGGQDARPVDTASPLAAPPFEPLLQLEEVQQQIEQRRTAASHLATAATVVATPPARLATSAALANGTPAGLGGNNMMRAIADYQDTMRHFLSSQERVLMSALGALPDGGAGLTQAPSMLPALTQLPLAQMAMPTMAPVLAPAIAPVAPAPVSIPSPTSAPAQAAAILGREAIAALVREVVASCSGYPESVLSPKHDLESELGIDSIKRVEIVEEIQRRLPPSLLAHLGAKTGELAKAKTLDQIADILGAAQAAAASTATTAPLAPNVTASAALANAAVSLSAPELVALVREVVSELTGYPTETLSLQQDMEADLGIDSIKRVEIAEHIVRRLPAELAERLRTQSDGLARAKRLQDIDALLLTLLQPRQADTPAEIARPAMAATPQRPIASSAPLTQEACPGFSIVYEPAPLPEVLTDSLPNSLAKPSSTTALAGKRVLLIAGDAALTAAVAAQLDALGAHAVTLPWALASQADELAKFLAGGENSAVNAIDAVIQLSGTHPAPYLPAHSEAWLQAALHTVLPVAQHCLPAWSESGTGTNDCLRWLAVTRVAGQGAGSGETGLLAALAGGIAGLLRCLHIEHPEAAVRALDLPAELELDAVAAAEIVLRELQFVGHVDGKDLSETVSWQSGARRAMRLQAWSAPESAAGTPFRHVLAIGGIRGITAHSLLTLGGPQTRFSIVARGAPEAAEDPASAVIPDIHGLRGYFARTLAQGGNIPQAREIERRARIVVRDRAARAALAQLRATGSAVEVVTADALDRAAVGTAIRAIQERFGPPDCVVHGAGIIEDKRLLDKKAESWRRVVDTKLNPVLAIGEALDASRLRKIVFFGSVAGSVGNLGQSDYALANEALNYAGLAFAARWPEVSVTTVNWGPWAGLGMASDAVNQQFDERGIKAIQPDAGAAFFRSAVWNGPLQLVAGAGYWASPSRQLLP